MIEVLSKKELFVVDGDDDADNDDDDNHDDDDDEDEYELLFVRYVLRLSIQG